MWEERKNQTSGWNQSIKETEKDLSSQNGIFQPQKYALQKTSVLTYNFKGVLCWLGMRSAENYHLIRLKLPILRKKCWSIKRILEAAAALFVDQKGALSCGTNFLWNVTPGKNNSTVYDAKSKHFEQTHKIQTKPRAISKSFDWP